MMPRSRRPRSKCSSSSRRRRSSRIDAPYPRQVDVMRIRSPKDFWSGLFFIAIAAGFIGLSHQYSTGTMHRMGPGLFPTLVSVVLVGLGLIIALRAFAIDGPLVPRFHARPIIVSLIAIALFGVALAQLGLLAAVAVVVLL